MSTLRKVFALLSSRYRGRFVLLLVLTAVSGILEIAGVGLVIPFIAVASNSSPFGKANQMTQALTEFLGGLGVPAEHLTLAMGLVFLLGIAISNGFLAICQYYSLWLIQSERTDLGIRVMRVLASRDLGWLDRENSADLTKLAFNDVQSVIDLLAASIQILAVISRSLLIFVFFLATQFRLAVGLFCGLLLGAGAVAVLIHRPIARAGRRNHALFLKMYRVSHELVGGARAIRVTASEQQFLERYRETAVATVHPQVVRNMPAVLSRAALETVVVGLVIALLVYFNAKDGNLGNGLPLLSAYAVAGVRLLPGLQQALSLFLGMRFAAPGVDEVARLLEVEPDEACLVDPPARPPLREGIELDRVTFGYERARPVLHSISLSIPRQSRVAFVGETGAGKSTVIDLLLALREPQEGALRVDGQTISGAETSRAWRRHVGYVPQSIYLLDATVAENVAFGESSQALDMERVRAACRAASIDRFIEGLPDQYCAQVGERGVRLSGGQCQRIGIARALYRDPEVVIFDEATSALDSVTEGYILEALERLKGEKTLVVIAHRLNTVWDFDTLFVLDQGRLVAQGTAPELLESSPVFARLAQAQVQLTTSRALAP